jgi:hypothetical protein
LVSDLPVPPCSTGEAVREARHEEALVLAQAAYRMDATTGRIVAATLTDHAVDDASQVGLLLDRIADPVASVTGEEAYD